MNFKYRICTPEIGMFFLLHLIKIIAKKNKIKLQLFGYGLHGKKRDYSFPYVSLSLLDNDGRLLSSVDNLNVN